MTARSGDPSGCITERETPHGYWWRYAPSRDEPGENLIVALRGAMAVAAEQARKSGKAYIVATGLHPSPAVYALAGDHPDTDMDIIYEFLPDGRRIRRHRSPREL
jgi:hypothetical protein